MAVMNRSRFRKELQEGLNTIFGMAYREHSPEWPMVFTTENSTKAYEEDVLLVGLGGAPVKEEGAGVHYDAGAEGWVARYKHKTIALAFAITEEASEDNLYGKMGAKYARALARSHQHTKEVDGASVLNNGFDSNYAGGDGVELFSLVHPLYAGGTFANEPDTPADLSEEALEDALVRISKWTDDRGLQIKIMAKKLCVPPELVFESERILGNRMYQPNSADNNINAMVNLGMFPGGSGVNHYLTDPDQFNIITDCPDGLKHMVRIRIQRGVEGDFDSGNMRYKARQRYSFGFTNPRGAYASPGGGS